MDEWVNFCHPFSSSLIITFLSSSFSKGKTERSHIQLFWKHVVESYSGKGIINRIVDWRHSLWKTFWQCWLFRKGSLPPSQQLCLSGLPPGEACTHDRAGGRMLAAACSGGRHTCVSVGEQLETRMEHPHAQPLPFAIGFSGPGTEPGLEHARQDLSNWTILLLLFTSSYFKAGSHLIKFSRLGMNLLCKPEVLSILLPQLSKYPGWQDCVTGVALVLNLGRKYPPHEMKY